MQPDTLAKAVKYNRQRPYSADIWREIQALIGAAIDGDPGPKTAEALSRWQRRNGIKADGQCGRKTYERLGLDPRRVWAIAAVRARLAPGRAVGIDVSVYQDQPDWCQVAREVDFVWMRSTRGQSDTDSEFARNWRETERVKLPRGAYHLARLHNLGGLSIEGDARVEAESFVRLLGGDPGELPPVCDAEAPLVRGLFDAHGASGVADWLEAFFDVVDRELGRQCILYVSWHGGALIEPRPGLVERDHWFVYYPDDHHAAWDEPPRMPSGWPGRWCARQISNQGIVAGIKGDVDLNVLPGSLGALLEQGRRRGCR